MTGKDVKDLWHKTRAVAHISFSPEAGEMATIYWKYIFDGLLGNAWRNKSMDEAILLIKDDQQVSPQVAGFARRIDEIRRQQSPFAQSA